MSSITQSSFRNASPISAKGTAALGTVFNPTKNMVDRTLRGIRLMDETVVTGVSEPVERDAIFEDEFDAALCRVGAKLDEMAAKALKARREGRTRQASK